MNFYISKNEKNKNSTLLSILEIIYFIKIENNKLLTIDK